MIHAYKMHGYNVVLDVNSGSAHVADDIVYDILTGGELDGKYTAEDIEEAESEIRELKKQGLLFSDSNFEEAVVKEQKTVVKALCLHVSHDCNLKCRYCFADEGEYRGKRELMSLETGKASIDFLVENSGNRINLEVDFFGGEPLLNLDVVKEIVSYARAIETERNKKFRFTMTTNGILLNDEIAAYLKENMDNIVLSLDGRREVNDKMRIKAGGAGSYDTVLPKFQKLAQDIDNYYIRGTFTSENLDFSKDALHLADLGFKSVSVEPVVLEEDNPLAIKSADLEIIYKEYESLADEIIARNKSTRGFDFFHFLIDLTGGPCIYKRASGCGAGSEYLAVAPSGEFYPCHQFVGIKEFSLGHIQDGKIMNSKMSERFKKCNVFSKEDCKNCFAKFYCSGGCAANAYNANGDIMKPYEIGCKLQRKRVECAIYIKAATSSIK